MMFGFKLCWLGSVPTKVGGFRWARLWVLMDGSVVGGFWWVKLWVPIDGWGSPPLRFMVGRFMDGRFKACTTTEVRHFSASIFCFILCFFFFWFLSLAHAMLESSILLGFVVEVVVRLSIWCWWTMSLFWTVFWVVEDVVFVWWWLLVGGNCVVVVAMVFLDGSG